MLASITSLFVLIVLAGFRVSPAHSQISHLQDWTTIPKFEISFDPSPSIDGNLDAQLPVIDYNLDLQNGTRYTCSIPDLRNANGRSQDEPEGEDFDALSPQQLRSKMGINFEIALSDKCARKSEGFWSFEICPFKEARQIHVDADRELMSFSLGKFHRSYWDDDGRFVHEFKHGTDGRSCTATFSCGPRLNDRVQLSFIEVREPSPLNYQMRLETPSLCIQKQKSVKPFTMLYSLNSKCIFLNKGWWSYEFCHLGYVRQFHTERIKAERVEGDQDSVLRFQTVTTASFILGRFPGNASDPDYVNNRTSLIVGDSPCFTQEFIDGSDCDLTGTKRETEIRFFCNRNIDSAKFTSIKETKTCSYLVEIETPTVCSHPNFSKKDAVVYTIKCTTQQNKGNNPVPTPDQEASKRNAPTTKKENELGSAQASNQPRHDAVNPESTQTEMNNIARDEL